MGHISREEILMGRDTQYPLTPALEANLAVLLDKVNQFRDIYNIPMSVTSGYRPGHFNTDAGGAKGSAHLVCSACDFADGDGALDAYCDAHPEILAQIGLWRESPASTPGWCHLDTRDRGPVHTFLP